jgi:hypothetical protein
VQLVFEISAELGIHIVEASGIAEPMQAELADYAAQWDAERHMIQVVGAA